MTSIQIFQNYITHADLPSLDPNFIPYDWTHNPHPKLREIAIFFDIFEKNRHLEAEYTGLLSKRFGEKTNMPGSQLIQFIKNNPGYDVYFINPFHYLKMYTYNNWDHGEFYHPGIIELTQHLLIQAKTNITVDRTTRQHEKTSLYCNYWVGNSKFWESFVSFLKHLVNTILSMPAQERDLYFSNTSYIRGETAFFPFIFERLFSTYIAQNKNITYLAYPYTLQEAARLPMPPLVSKIFTSAYDFFEKNEHANPELTLQTVKMWRSFIFGIME